MDNRKYNEKDVTASLDGIAEAIKSGGLAPSVIADPYSDESTYAVGDYVTFNAKSYRCITAIVTPEEFDSEKWDEIKVLDELASAVELPPVTSTDNGKILSVVEGEWSKADAPTELPAIGNFDNGKILKIVSREWTKADDYHAIFVPTPNWPNVTVNKAFVDELTDKDYMAITMPDDHGFNHIFTPYASDLIASGSYIYYETFYKDSGTLKRMSFAIKTGPASGIESQTFTVESEAVGGGGGYTLVTITKNGSTYTADKTYAEISSAVDSGLEVRVKNTDSSTQLNGNVILTLSYVDPNLSSYGNTYFFNGIQHNSSSSATIQTVVIDYYDVKVYENRLMLM